MPSHPAPGLLRSMCETYKMALSPFSLMPARETCRIARAFGNTASKARLSSEPFPCFIIRPICSVFGTPRPMVVRSLTPSSRQELLLFFRKEATMLSRSREGIAVPDIRTVWASRGHCIVYGKIVRLSGPFAGFSLMRLRTIRSFTQECRIAYSSAEIRSDRNSSPSAGGTGSTPFASGEQTLMRVAAKATHTSTSATRVNLLISSRRISVPIPVLSRVCVRGRRRGLCPCTRLLRWQRAA